MENLSKVNGTYLASCCAFFFFLSCGGTKQMEGIPSASEQTQIESTTIDKNENPSPALQEEILEKHKIHPDTIKKWDKELADNIEKYIAKPDAETKYFKIDENTGEITGCPLLKMNALTTGDVNVREKNFYDSSKIIKELLLPTIKAYTMESKPSELWYGDPRNVEIEGSPESVHSGVGPIGFLRTKDNSFIIVPIGYPHGGSMYEIIFLDQKGNLLNRYSFNKTLNAPNILFNKEETFVTISDSGTGDFYIFNIEGELFKKGNYNKLTGDKGTSYGFPLVSKTGKYWALRNNLKYIYRDDELVYISPLNIDYISELSDYAHYYRMVDRKTRTIDHYFIDLKKGTPKYIGKAITYPKNLYYEYID